MRAADQVALRPITLFAAAALCVAALGWPQAGRADVLTVPLDHSTRLRVSGVAEHVVVGNPLVADVTVVDSHNIFISGRGYGVTDIIVMDGQGHALYSGEVMVSTPATGRVSVWRGGARTDMACAPGCQVSVRSGAVSASGGSAAPAAAPSAGPSADAAPAAPAT